MIVRNFVSQSSKGEGSHFRKTRISQNYYTEKTQRLIAKILLLRMTHIALWVCGGATAHKPRLISNTTVIASSVLYR